MTRPLRTLSGLLDFECAARWNSFKDAAQELHKTPAAVSQQIRQLEETLGFDLFVRHPRSIALTTKGTELAATLTHLLGELNAKIESLDSGEENVLRISAMHSFAMKWLVPRLRHFTERHPEFDIRIDATDKVADVRDGSCDIAIRYVPVAGDDDAALLYRDRWLVVVSPDLAKTSHPKDPDKPLSLDRLVKYPLLCEGAPEDWLRLLKDNDITGRQFDFSRSYSHSGILVQAAVSAQGVGLAPASIAAEEIRAGRLLCVPCKLPAAEYGYRLLCDPRKEGMPKVMLFKAWIAGEMAAMDEALNRLLTRPRAPAKSSRISASRSKSGRGSDR